MICGKRQSSHSVHSGMFLLSALNQSRSSWLRLPDPYFWRFRVCNLSPIMIKNDDLMRSRTLERLLMFISPSEICFSSCFISSWSCCNWDLKSGCFSRAAFYGSTMVICAGSFGVSRTMTNGTKTSMNAGKRLEIFVLLIQFIEFFVRAL